MMTTQHLDSHNMNPELSVLGPLFLGSSIAESSKVTSLSSASDSTSRSDESSLVGLDVEAGVLLPAPSAQAFKRSYVFSESENFSIIDVMAEMTAALSIASSRAYETQYTQGVLTSQYSLSLANIGKELATTAAEHNADATRSDANKENQAGWLVLGTAVLGGIIGFVGFRGEMQEKSGADGLLKEVGEEGAEAATRSSSRAASQATQAAASAESRAASAVADGGAGASLAPRPPAPTIARAPTPPTPPAPTPAEPEPLLKDSAKKATSSASKLGKFSQGMNSIFSKIHMMLMMGEGAINLGVNSKCDYTKATEQQEAGRYEGIKEENSGYQQYSNTASQQMIEASGQSSKTQSEAVAALGRMSDGITNVVLSAQRS